MMRIDAHHHLWRYNPAEYGWIAEDMRVLRRDFLVPELREQMRSANVDGAVAVQARQTVEETRWLLELAGSEPSLLGVVGWLPLADASLERILQPFLKQSKLKGLRHVVQGEPAGFLDAKAFNRGISALRGTGLVYDLLIYARQLGEAARFVDRHPTQPFVLDHLGKPAIRDAEFTQWASGIRELAKRPHVSCKVSGLVTEADWTQWTPEQLVPYFDTVLEAFGAERLMIGTDWPVLTLGCTYAWWWRTVEAWIAHLSRSEQEQITGATATRVYNLEATPEITEVNAASKRPPAEL